MRVIERGQGADALELLGANLDAAEAFGVVEMGRGAVCHGQTCGVGILRRTIAKWSREEKS
jgi:hypothetical protein